METPVAREVTTHIIAGQEFPEAAVGQQPQPGRPSLRGLIARGLSRLLLSTALFEVTGNIVYVMLMERTFDLGGPASVGVFLVIQAAAQLLLGSFVGSFADTLGARRAGVFGLFALASLALGLAYAASLGIVYALALHITIARLFVITSRLPLISELSTRSGYLQANTAVTVLEGIGLTIGPALAALLALIWNDLRLAFLIASGMYLLSAFPLLIWPRSAWRPITKRATSLLVEIKDGWRHILRFRPIWAVLVCLAISSLAFGAIVPMLTPLARRAGLGIEGSGIFVAGLGLGWTLGPLLAGRLARRLSYTRALLVAGLMTPLAALTIGFLHSAEAILISLVAASLGGGSLQVIAFTVIQRLTPRAKQGSVMGTEQALSAVMWILSAAAVTVLSALTPAASDPRWLFVPTGIFGALAVLACWSFGRRTLQALVDGVASKLG